MDREWYWKRDHLWVDDTGKRWVADLLYGPGNHLRETHRKRSLGATEVWPPPQAPDPAMTAREQQQKQAADERARLISGIQGALLREDSILDAKTREEFQRTVEWRKSVGG